MGQGRMPRTSGGRTSAGAKKEMSGRDPSQSLSCRITLSLQLKEPHTSFPVLLRALGP